MAKTTCEDVIAACQNTVEQKNLEIKLATKTIDDLIKQNGELQVKNEELTAETTSFWHNPFAMFVLGAAATSVAVTLLK